MYPFKEESALITPQPTKDHPVCEVRQDVYREPANVRSGVDIANGIYPVVTQTLKFILSDNTYSFDAVLTIQPFSMTVTMYALFANGGMTFDASKFAAYAHFYAAVGGLDAALSYDIMTGSGQIYNQTVDADGHITALDGYPTLNTFGNYKMPDTNLNADGYRLVIPHDLGSFTVSATKSIYLLADLYRLTPQDDKKAIPALAPSLNVMQ